MMEATAERKTPAASDKAKGHRVQFEFSPEAYQHLQEMRERAGAKTYAEVVRSALRLYEWFLDQKSNDAKILVDDGDSTRQVEFLL